MSKPLPPKYRTTNWPAYNRALRQRASLTVWLDPDMPWFAPPGGKNGRPQTYSDAAIQCFLTLKGLFGLPLRQTQGLLQSLIDLMNLDWTAPDSSTICRRQQHLQVNIPCRPANGALHLLIDSTGIKMLGEGEWKVKKHGKESRRVWRKLHIGIDAQTLEIRALEVTENSVGDPTVLPALLAQIAPEEPLERVSADGAYDTRKCHKAIAARGAMAVIPPRKNAVPWQLKPGQACARTDAVRAVDRLGLAIWKTWSGYHRRSLVETKMRCIKLLGERISSRKLESQIAELQVRAAILNRFTRLGTPVTKALVA